MFLLDTNVISELRKGSRADEGFVRWMSKADPDDLYVSVIGIMENESGALRLARRDKAQGAILLSWIHERIIPAFEGRILPVDLRVAMRCAALHVPNPRGYRDALIAATALVHGLVMVTRNVRDFEPTGVTIVNPWER